MKTKHYHPDQPMQPDHNQSYILRLWRGDRSNTADWRASLEILESGQRVGFASLEQLFAYLIDLCERNDEYENKFEQG
jgi:hypothetical protein